LWNGGTSVLELQSRQRNNAGETLTSMNSIATTADHFWSRPQATLSGLVGHLDIQVGAEAMHQQFSVAEEELSDRRFDFAD
jgi:hypothetical protein